jgi:cell wall-associated NlpC family hydrolase
MITALAVTALAACASTRGRPGDPVTVRSPGSDCPVEVGVGRDEIVRRLAAHYKEWVGVPHVLGGDGRDGIDCSSFTQLTFRQLFGVRLPRTTWALSGVGLQIERWALRAGDLVFFREPGFRHVGIALGDGSFLHASETAGVMLSRLDDRHWRRSFWMARRVIDP